MRSRIPCRPGTSTQLPSAGTELGGILANLARDAFRHCKWISLTRDIKPSRSKFPAFNGWKLTITLEELKEAGKLPEGFTVEELDLESKQHKEPWFLAINPNGRIPALVDHARGGRAVFESCAMMLYLAETRGYLLPSADVDGGTARYSALQWLFFQASSIGPIQGQTHAFLRYVPEEVPYAQRRFVNETARLYGVLDEALSTNGPYIAGTYSIADIALFPWVRYHVWAGQTLEHLPALEAWCERVAARPAAIRGLEYNKKDVKALLASAADVRAAVAATTLDNTDADALEIGRAHV